MEYSSATERPSNGRATPRPATPSRIDGGPRNDIAWGGSKFSLDDEDEGFYRISGTTGSGKSHLTKLFLLNVLKEVVSNPHAKLVVYEPKREFYAWLSSLDLTVPITYFMPSDRRSVALDFTEDYRDDQDAMTLAHAFYPEKPSGHESPFWGNALRTIFAGVYTAIRAKLKRVDLRLVLLVLEDEELTKSVLGFDPYLVQARKLAGVLRKSESETLQNIQYSIHSRIGEMKPLAAHLDCAARERPLFSLRRFIDEEKSGILVLSKDDTYRLSQAPMNGVLFLRLTQLLDKKQADPRRKVFVVIDEFPDLCGDDRCPGVRTMFLRLRSRGAIPLITDQGLTALKPLYGDDTTAIIGQCHNVIYLKQPDPESIEYATKDLGRERGYETRTSVSYGGEYAHISESEFYYERTIIEEGKIDALAKASKRRGVEGYARSDLNTRTGPWYFQIPPEKVDLIPRTGEDFPEYKERSPDTQRLRQLSEPESRDLGGLNDSPKPSEQGSNSRPAPSNKESMSEETKLRVVEYQGETLEFACTDQELEFFMKPSSLDVFWWRKQQKTNPTFNSEWGDLFFNCKNKEEIEALRQKMYAHWRSRKGGTSGTD